MTDPIAGGSSRKLESSYEDEVCREAPEPQVASPSHEEVVSKLPVRAVDFSKMTVAKETNTNLERTTARDGVAPYAAAGVTSSGDSAFAGVALLKGRNSKSGIEAEVLSASVQGGLQNEVQVGVVRIGGSTDDGTSSGTVEAIAARAAVGIHNADGSTGLNVALTATALGFEGSHMENGRSVTGGAGLGVGGEVSIGLRDGDHDGKTELCVRLGMEPGVLGYCLEKPW